MLQIGIMFLESAQFADAAQKQIAVDIKVSYQ